jgi:hypothetical protein
MRGENFADAVGGLQLLPLTAANRQLPESVTPHFFLLPFPAASSRPNFSGGTGLLK